MPCGRSNEHLKRGQAHLRRLLETRCQKCIMGGEYKNRTSYSGSSEQYDVQKEEEGEGKRAIWIIYNRMNSLDN